MVDLAEDDVHLEAGALRATVSPLGAALRRLWLEGANGVSRDYLWGYSGTANKKGGQGDVLIPFPGRIAGGAYSFQNQKHALPLNDKDGPNAIHGFVRNKMWGAGPHTKTTAQFRTTISSIDNPGYPFDLDIALGYELQPTGLACAFVIRNAGTKAAPVGAGFHPYILTPNRVDAASIQIPASNLVEFEGLLPTGKILDLSADHDFRVKRAIGQTKLNHCYTGLTADRDGFVRIQVNDVELWMDGNFPYVVAYTGDSLGADARRAIAIEPMTCATDAFNRAEWGLRVLAPGELMSGTWGVGPAPRKP